MKKSLKIEVSFVVIIALIAISYLKSDEWGPFSSFLTNTVVTNITSDGGTARTVLTLLSGDPTITEHGFVWSTSPTLNISLPTKHVVTESTAPSQTPLQYEFAITGLNTGQVYYVAAYCKEGANVYYGEPVSFTTIPTLPEWGIISMISLIAVAGGWFVWRKVA